MSDSTPIDQKRHLTHDRNQTPAVFAGGQPVSTSSDAALSTEFRIRAALIGIALAVLVAAIAVVIALLIVAGPFHTSLGHLA